MAAMNLTIRIDSGIKENASRMFEDMGLSLSAAFNIFLRQSLREGRIPFMITSGLAATKAALKEADEIVAGTIPAKHYDSVDDLFNDNLAECADLAEVAR